MPHVRTQHPNASLTPRGRRKMVRLVIDHGWTIEAAADRFQVDAKTVTKWRDRFLTEGDDGSARSVEPTEVVTERDTAGVSASDRRATPTAPLGRCPHRPRGRPRRLNGPEDPDRRGTRPARLR